MQTIPDLLKEHADLEVECIDRVYLNGYIPGLQRSGGLTDFIEQHRGELIGSPAILEGITRNFAAEMDRYAAAHNIPLIRSDI